MPEHHEPAELPLIRNASMARAVDRYVAGAIAEAKGDTTALWVIRRAQTRIRDATETMAALQAIRDRTSRSTPALRRVSDEIQAEIDVLAARVIALRAEHGIRS